MVNCERFRYCFDGKRYKYSKDYRKVLFTKLVVVVALVVGELWHPMGMRMGMEHGQGDRNRLGHEHGDGDNAWDRACAWGRGIGMGMGQRHTTRNPAATATTATTTTTAAPAPSLLFLLL